MFALRKLHNTEMERVLEFLTLDVFAKSQETETPEEGRSVGGVGVSILGTFEGGTGFLWVGKGMGRVKEGNTLSKTDIIVHLLHEDRNPCFGVGGTVTEIFDFELE